jgi:VIT1/CCC1 family predicted Fe2+/Mn2+ transporter
MYVIFYFAGATNADLMFGLTCGATALTMFLLGVFKAKVTSQSLFKSGAMMTLNGSIAAAAAYLVGYMFEKGFDIKMSAC